MALQSDGSVVDWARSTAVVPFCAAAPVILQNIAQSFLDIVDAALVAPSRTGLLLSTSNLDLSLLDALLVPASYPPV
ncbi:unnamed protein product [Phytophthora lilii]|uniref:Unnamed protein product n=1 Tax=Phytophthora lilii TaxID=2077276 RepID=A0A9W6U0K7_9STRA|nr:unnamed protein product [Phytophthora lilii]